MAETATSATNASVEASFEEPQASKIFRIIFFSLTTLASLLGNSVMLKAARELPSRKPLSYHLVTNLAAVEIIQTLCNPFLFVYMYLDYWPFGEVACKIVYPIVVLSMPVVTNTLAAIAVYRFALIVFQVRITVSDCRLIVVLSLLWLASIAVCMPFFVYTSTEITVEGKMHCFIKIFKGYGTYEISRFTLEYGLTYLIMVVSYGAVALKLKRHINRKKKEEAEMSKLGESTKHTQEEAEAIQQQLVTEATKRERKKSSHATVDLENDLLKMVYTVIIAFVVCYLPFQVQFLFSVLEGYERYPEVVQYASIIQQYCFLLTCLSSALHPLCYGTMSKFYARPFSRLVLCRCKSAE